MKIKVFSIIMVMALVVSLAYQPITVKASEDAVADKNKELVQQEIKGEEFWRLLEVFISDEECYSCESEELLESCLGDLFQIPEVDEEGNVVYNDQLWHAFLYNGNQVTAMIDFIVDGDYVFSFVSESYVDKVNNSYGKKMKMYYDDGEFVCMSKKMYKSKDVLNKLGANGFIKNVKAVKMNTGDIKITVQDKLERFRMSKTVEDEDEDDSSDGSDSTEGDFSDSDDESDFSDGSTQVSKKKELKNYPIVSQNDKPICWAASVASMLRYEYPKKYGNITAENVAYSVGHFEGAPIQLVQTAMNNYFSAPYVPTIINKCLTKKNIKKTIKNNDPAYIQGVTADGSSAHAVALMGYQVYGSEFRIRFMNPATNKIHWGEYGASRPFKFRSGTNIYTWTKTIRLLYK